jgi:hypothetical protein
VKLITSLEVKSEWSFTSTPPLSLHDVDRENFTFYVGINRMARWRKIWGSTMERKVKNLEGKNERG